LGGEQKETPRTTFAAGRNLTIPHPAGVRNSVVIPGEYEDSHKSGAQIGADSRLAQIIDAWPMLTEAVQLKIVALVMGNKA
jgi:hypothetical protein